MSCPIPGRGGYRWAGSLSRKEGAIGGQTHVSFLGIPRVLPSSHLRRSGPSNRDRYHASPSHRLSIHPPSLAQNGTRSIRREDPRWQYRQPMDLSQMLASRLDYRPEHAWHEPRQSRQGMKVDRQSERETGLMRRRCPGRIEARRGSGRRGREGRGKRSSGRPMGAAI
jgi:hypothetical protein